MSRMPDNFIDLIITSPPYDEMRSYRGYSFPFEKIAAELFRITKYGGIVVWVVSDQTVDGDETGSSFRQALFFKDTGYDLYRTMLYIKPPRGASGNNKTYWQSFEYMFVFSKGGPKTINLPLDKDPYRWTYKIGKGHSTKDQIAFQHPAIFPEQLASDHIRCWSNEGDIVYDPCAGSGTVAKSSITLNRKWIASETSQEYCNIIRQRVAQTNPLFS